MSDILAFPQTPDARLRTALRRLDAAIAEQAAAIAAWRADLAALKAATEGLGTSVTQFQARLADCAEATTEAAEAHHRLARTMEIAAA